MKKTSVSGVAVAVIACIFVVTILGTLLFGVSVYKSITESSNEVSNRRICLSYMSAKIHSADEQDLVYVSEFCGLPALCIDEDIDGMLFHTVIYAYGGKLREINYLDGLEFGPDAGEEIADAESLELSQSGRMITITYTDAAGNVVSDTTYLRSGEVAS